MANKSYMAGIYLHIPFCKTRCIYCDFYSTTFEELHEKYIHALCIEISERKDYLDGQPVRTVYLGGGTPSQLEPEYLQLIFNSLAQHYDLSQCEEITMEANPDDITPDYLDALRRLPINRISLGIQTFDDGMLKLLNRRHDAAEAIQAVRLCREKGFTNISIDLIYGLPGETQEQWEHDLDEAISLKPEHISAYSLSYEEGTPLTRLREAGKIQEAEEQNSLLFYERLMERLEENGYEHYEISNFCLPHRYSRHNSAYWQGIPYLGCGAAAHSYNGDEREWNVADIHKYISGIENRKRDYESEKLSPDMKYEEYVMTSLRTAQGIHLDKLKTFGNDKFQHCLEMAGPYLRSGKLNKTGEVLKLTKKGIFVSDEIIRDLF